MSRGRRRVHYLTVEEATYIREYVVHRYFKGSGPPLPGRPTDLGLLDSALRAPAQTFDGRELFPTIQEKAACLFRSLVKNHAFLDGNKRTAVVATVLFLVVNFRIVLAVQDEMYELATRVADSTDNDKIMTDLREWFGRRVFPRWP